MSDKPVTLAAIIGAHGVAGEVRLKLFSESVGTLARCTSFDAGGKAGTLRLVKVRSDNKGGAVARFEGVGDRNAAEALRGTVLTVPRSALPPLDEGEFYHSDLLGLSAVSDADEPLGIVCAVENFGATDIIEIERPDGKRFMVPLTPFAVPGWDSERLVVAADFAGQ
ncbi:MAG: 16S rRNA processing protein RimM [Erythrobacter sp. 34-65-8]|nr:MAG: 16S rRNA processing protein RimM [Erythrobacter sp. 34-65-8]